jgi:Zn-dependent peptidase ImmA (M78 family)
MTNEKRKLAERALNKAIEVRLDANLGVNGPINVLDLCADLGLDVRFLAVNMDGMYVDNVKPAILLSSLRPQARRNYTCGHELGHKVFGHGMCMDVLMQNVDGSQSFIPEEFLAHSFSGHLLMPIIAVRKAFAIRGWHPSLPTPAQVFIVACSLGVGYETLIKHMAYALKVISNSKAASLLNYNTSQVRREILGYSSKSPLIVADLRWTLSTLDTEVGCDILLPVSAESRGDQITLVKDLSMGRLFKAERPGIVQVECKSDGWSVSIRVSPQQFVGPLKHRHMEDVNSK